MVHVLKVLLISLTGYGLMVTGAGIQDPSAPEGLEPVELLQNPTQHKFMPMRGSGYEVEREHKPDQVDDTDYKKKNSLWISKYLQYLMNMKNRRSDPTVRNALDVMSLLVAHSWLYSFNPEKSLLKGTTPLIIDESEPLSKIKDDIARELRERNARTAVSDVVLYYNDAVFPSIKDDLKTDVDAYRKMVFDKSFLVNIFDYNVKETVINDNDRYTALLAKYKLLLDFHPVALKMALQSLLKLFVTGLSTSQDKFWLQSSNGRDRKLFPMPPMAADKYQQMVFEAEMEDQFSNPEQTREQYRQQQNTVIAQYLKELEILRKTSMSNFQDGNTLNVVKLLLIQSWIHMFRPVLTQVALVYTVEEYASLDGIHQNVILDLKKTMAYTEVVDAIIRFNNVLHKQIRSHFMLQAREVCPKIERTIELTSSYNYGTYRDSMVTLKKDHVAKLNELKLMIQFHEITMKMCLQSYVLDFLKEPYRSVVVLTSTTGDRITMDLPLLSKDAYEIWRSEY